MVNLNKSLSETPVTFEALDYILYTVFFTVVLGLKKEYKIKL